MDQTLRKAPLRPKDNPALAEARCMRPARRVGRHTVTQAGPEGYSPQDWPARVSGRPASGSSTRAGPWEHLPVRSLRVRLAGLPDMDWDNSLVNSDSPAADSSQPGAEEAHRKGLELAPAVARSELQ
jgi:hypothetical protein